MVGAQANRHSRCCYRGLALNYARSSLANVRPCLRLNGRSRTLSQSRCNRLGHSLVIQSVASYQGDGVRISTICTTYFGLLPSPASVVAGQHFR